MAYRYLLSAFLVLLAWVSPTWVSAMEIPLFVVLVGSIGILHGALDHQVAFKYYGIQADRRGWALFLAGYLGVMAVYGALWVVFPLLALILFLGLSVWHFGQSDMHAYSMERGAAIMNVTRSFAVLGVMFGMHLDEVKLIVGDLLPWHIPPEAGYLMSGGGLALHAAAVVWFKPELRSHALWDTAWLGLVSAVLPLLLAFAVYFALWHSTNHLSELRGYLGYDRWSSLVRNGLPFTVLALAIVAVFAFWLPSGGRSMEWVLFLFVAISLMTLPHMLLVDKMMQR